MTDTITNTDLTDTDNDDTDLGFEVNVVDEVPKIEREQPKSKYHRLFDMAENADTRIVSFKVEDEEGDEHGKKASARASYLRRIAPDNVEVNQRGESVYVKALTEAEVAERDAAAEAAESNEDESLTEQADDAEWDF